MQQVFAERGRLRDHHLRRRVRQVRGQALQLGWHVRQPHRSLEAQLQEDLRRLRHSRAPDPGAPDSGAGDSRAPDSGTGACGTYIQVEVHQQVAPLRKRGVRKHDPRTNEDQVHGFVKMRRIQLDRGRDWQRANRKRVHEVRLQRQPRGSGRLRPHQPWLPGQGGCSIIHP